MSSMNNFKTDNVRMLGDGSSYTITEPNPSILETFDGPVGTGVSFNCAEFTSFCPKTGQPDFATLNISYQSSGKYVETKSLKVYLQSYRNERAFMEALVNQIKDHLVQVLNPQGLMVTGNFTARGGISTTVVATHKVSMEGRI